jgi:hypothetical protein
MKIIAFVWKGAGRQLCDILHHLPEAGDLDVDRSTVSMRKFISLFIWSYLKHFGVTELMFFDQGENFI